VRCGCGAYVMDAAGRVSPGAESAAEPCSDSGFSGVYPGGRVWSPIVGPEVVTVGAGIESIEVREDLRREGDFLELAALAAGEGYYAAVAVDVGGVELEHYSDSLPAEIEEAVKVAEFGICEHGSKFRCGENARSLGKVAEPSGGEPMAGVVERGHESPRVEGVEQCANVRKLGVDAGGLLTVRAESGGVVVEELRRDFIEILNMLFNEEFVEF